MQQGGGSESEVTWEDQQNINKFGRLNNRFHELEDEIKAAKVILSFTGFASGHFYVPRLILFDYCLHEF
ncbi:hypothetical protein J5N97_025912 [Dioscorea zingiberensis]|uniref:Uncharacterized protein n=1 Tax=Dioscorea zingiberensis TaxID=325984 RepID=A0A9D5H616_9LILI|nr:hypothetical protein J5N97_025912 [Dioscorea zingiberensis]